MCPSLLMISTNFEPVPLVSVSEAINLEAHLCAAAALIVMGHGR